MPPTRPRPPEQIVDDTAAARGLVTPVPPHMALSPAFAAACVREAYADVAAALAEAVAGRPETVAAVRPVLDALLGRAAGG